MRFNLTHAHRASLIAIALAAGTSFAQTTTLDPVVVTATRTAQPLTAVISDLTVIDSLELRSGPWTTVGELLQSLPGVEASQYGSDNLFIRGAESRMSLVLIDGIRVDRQDGYVNGGGAPWQLLPLDLLDRVEVLRGAASGVYGADAMGGVVQLFTRDGRGDPYRSVSLGIGSYSTKNAQVGLAARSDAWNYALQASVASSDGYDSQPQISHSPRNEAWDYQRLGFALGRELSVNHHLGVVMSRTQRSSQYVPWNGGNNTEVDGALVTAALNWEARWSEKWSSRVSLTRAHTEIYETTPKKFKTVGYGLLWDNTFKTDGGHWKFSLEQRRDTFLAEADGWGNPSQQGEREQQGVSLGWVREWGAFSAQLNARTDHDELFGTKSTWGGAVAYKLAPGWRLHAGTSTGYRSPTLSQLFDPAYGDPALQPETARSSELGLRYQGLGVQWQALLHQSRFDNLISSRPFDDATCRFCWYNVAAADTRGLSLSGRWVLGASRFGASMDWLNARNSQTGKRLNLRSPRKIAVSWELPLADWVMRNEWLIKSARFDDAANLRRLPGYGIWNFSAKRDLGQGWALQIRLDNLLDKTYQEIKDVDAPGRRWFLGVTWSGR